jgi:hypothetical protein
VAEIKGSLNYVLQSVLSIGNKEPNMQYPPSVFSSHFNIVTSFLLDKGIEAYPKSLDVLRPFVLSKKVNTQNGYVILPAEYRNMLGVPSISAKKDGSGECNEPINKNSFEAEQNRSGCNTVAIEMLPQNEWDERTQSTYAKPSYKKPIGCFFGADRFKVCPYDIGSVEVRFVRKENVYVYGYTMQPDDTYIFNAATSAESEWGNAASEFLVKGVYALYAAYLRDDTSMTYSRILNEAGLF